MKSTLHLRVECVSRPTAKTLASVLASDNKALPSDQRMSMSVTSRSVVFRIESERTRSALTTVCSVLRDIALFQEIWLISRARSG